MVQKLIIDDHLQILPYRNGIKLINPLSENKSMFTISHFKTAPFSVYFLDENSFTIKINDEGAHVCGFISAKDAIGKSLLDVSKKHSALHLMHNSISVIKNKGIKIFEEENLRNDHLAMQFLSIKLPWYNESNKIIGSMGCSIVIGQHSLANSLSEIYQLGILTAPSDSFFPEQKMSYIPLSKRESECLKFTLKGYTAKKIAKTLRLSPRTVEEYIYNVRIKMGASSKTELIEMAFETNLIQTLKNR